MKNKSAHHKEENTFQFQSFAERISNIDIDIFHRVPHEHEASDSDVECNFYLCIQKWNLLCLTQEYQHFHKNVTGIITLPQLLHRKQQVIDELLKYIQLQDLLSVQAYLELLVAFAKDLQKDFYQYYPLCFNILITLLKTKESDQIEWTFTTLAHLFKLMWRSLIKDIQNVFESLLPLLSDNQPDYVRNFASESFAFVARKIKDRKMFLSLILKSVQDSDDGVSGSAKLLFEVMNGVDGNFHSCSESFLTFLLQALSDSDVDQNLLFSILEKLFQNICSGIKPQNNNAFWNCIFQIFDEQITIFKERNNSSCFDSYLCLIRIVVEYKNGKFLTSHKSCLVKKMDTVLKLPELNEVLLISVSKLCVLLLKSQHIHLTQEESVLISSKLLRVPSKIVLLQFVENVIDYSLFDVHILPYFIKECVANGFENEFLNLFCKILQTKVPFAESGIKLHNWHIYNIPFNSENDAKVCVNILLQNVQLQNSNLESCVQSLICLPHVANKDDRIVSILSENLSDLCSKIETSSSEEDLLILGYLIECLIHLNVDIGKLETHFETLLNSLLPLCGDRKYIRSLKILDLYLSCICNSNSHLKSLETLTKINAALNPNFSSPYHEVRLLTAHIYTLFEDLSSFDGLKVFSFCYSVESVPSTVETYRDQLQNLQKLSWNTSYISALKGTQFETLPLKYLIGVLYINFKLLWDPVSNLIATYAQEMSIATFWPIFFEELKRATLCKPEQTIEEDLKAEKKPLIEMSLNVSDQEDKPDFLNFRFHMWRTLNLFSDLAEMKTRDISELFLQFYQNEFVSPETSDAALVCNIKTNQIENDEGIAEESLEHADETKKKPIRKRKSGGGKNNIATLIQCLSVYGKVKSPLSMYREPELYKLYLELLSHKNAQIQKFALDCLMPYKHKYLTPYREHLYNLIDEKNFKNQLSLFRVDTESNLVQNEHRNDLMPLIMRIVYAKMTAKTGMRTGGKSNGQFRRNLVFRFLAGCQENEMILFIKMSFHFYDHFTDLHADDAEQLCAQLMKTADLEEFPSLKKLQSSANLLSVIFQQFGGLMSDQLLKLLLRILFVIAAHVTAALRQDSNVYVGYVSALRNVRSTCIKVLEKFYNKFERYVWTCEEVNAVFDVFVWPNLSKLSVENVTCPTALLRLINQWGQNPKYFHLLVKTSAVGDENDFVLKQVLRLLRGEKTQFSVVSVVMEIVERLLSLQVEEETEVHPANELNFGTKILIPHVVTLLEYFKSKLGRKRNFTQRELFILSRISELVTDPQMSDKILSLLLPILLKKFRTNASSETVVDAIATVANLLKVNEDPLKHIRLLCPLFGIVGSAQARKMLCSILTAVSEKSPDFANSATVVQKLNAWDAKWVEQADFQERLNGFKLIDNLGDEIDVDLGLLVIYNCWYFVQNEKDLSLRENSAHCLRVVGPILCRKYHKSSHKDLVINDTLLSLIRSGIKSKITEVRNESIGLLGHLARECPETYYVLEDLNRFTNKIDLEVDFFENLKHLQLHRRTRALLKFSQIAGAALEKDQNPLHCRTLTQFILPLTSQYLCSTHYMNKNSIIDAAIETMCTICRILPWHQYELLLKYYLSKLRHKSEFQRQLVRLLVGILDSFHFDLSNGMQEATAAIKEDAVKSILETAEQSSTVATEPQDEEETKKEVDDEEVILEEELLKDEAETTAVEQNNGKYVLSQSAATRVITTIQKVLLPQLYRTLGEMTHHESSHKVNRKQLGSEREEEELVKVPISLALIKLLQRLPKKLLDMHLSGIFMKLCSFLKSPLESVRRTARETMEKVMLSLGPEYLNCLLGEMVTLLSRGFQVHVLSYTMYSVVNCLKDLYKPGHIDSCLLTVLEICTRDLFGATAEEKQVSKIVSKVSEAKSKKSFDVFQLLAQYVTEKCLTDLLTPLKTFLVTKPSFKVINTVDECLRFVVLGLADNQFVSTESLMMFAYGLSSQAILSDVEKKSEEKKKKKVIAKEIKTDCFIIAKAPGRAKCAKNSLQINQHVLVEFGIRLCYFLLKREKVKNGGYLDPFIKIFSECLRSNHVKLCTLTLQCLSWCFKFELPALKEEIAEITKLMFGILHKYASSTGENAEIVVAAFKTMSVLVRDANYHTLDEDSLKILVLYIEQDLHSYERQATAFSLLKSIMSRKFSVKELYDLMKKIAEMSVTSELPHVRLQCRQIFQLFLLDYPIGNKVEQHVNFYLSQLEYEVQSGRESVLEMLLGLVRAFPVKTLKRYSSVLMISLAARLINDDSPECRKMVANCLNLLFERLPTASRDSLYDIMLLWFKDNNLNHKRLAAQLMGILVTVEKQDFENRFASLQEILLQQILQHDSNTPGQFVRLRVEEKSSEEKERLKDHQLFQTFQMLLKIVNNCPNFFRKMPDDFLENLAVNAQSLLSYPHDWVRLSAAQYLGLVLADLNTDKLSECLIASYKSSTDVDNRFLFSNPHDSIKSLTLDLCVQLKTDEVKQDLVEQVIKNLVVIARVLQAVPIELKESSDVQKINLLWLIKRLRRAVNAEIVDNAEKIVLRNEIFKWIGAVSTIVEEETLKPVLYHLMGPLVREMITTEQENAPLRQLSKEVGAILKRKVGIDLYTKTMHDVEQKINVKRAVRKRTRTQLAVTDPELFAKKKLKQQEKKKLSKKRKIQRGKGLLADNRKSKKRRADED